MMDFVFGDVREDLFREEMVGLFRRRVFFSLLEGGRMV